MSLQAAPPEGPLYPRLRARSNGISGEEVIANQRLRLQGAMVEAVFRHGYQGAGVDAIVKLAGVSTRTLYERFGNKQQCFLATFDAIVEQALGRVSAACWAGGRDDRDPLQALCDGLAALAAEIAERPKEARLVLLEVPAIGAAARPGLKRVEELSEELLFTALCRVAGCALPPLIAQGAAHGIWHIARGCLLDGGPERLSGLALQLAEWLICCAAPVARGLARGSERLATAPSGNGIAEMAARRRPPTGRESERVARERVLRVAAEIAATEGYAAASVARICELAELDLDCFLDRFGSAEECMGASLELLSAEALAGALRAVGPAPRTLDEWCEALHRAVAAMLRRIAEDRVLQRLAFAEMPEAGAKAIQRQDAIMRRFAHVLARRLPRSTTTHPLLPEAFVGALWGVARGHVLRGEAHLLPGQAKQLSYLGLAPIVGPKRAVAAILRAERTSERLRAGAMRRAVGTAR